MRTQGPARAPRPPDARLSARSRYSLHDSSPPPHTPARALAGGPLADQAPHFALAVHAVVLATGNASWLRALMPALEAVMGWVEANGIGAGGVFVVPGASGRADGGKHC